METDEFAGTDVSIHDQEAYYDWRENQSPCWLQRLIAAALAVLAGLFVWREML